MEAYQPIQPRHLSELRRNMKENRKTAILINDNIRSVLLYESQECVGRETWLELNEKLFIALGNYMHVMCRRSWIEHFLACLWGKEYYD